MPVVLVLMAGTVGQRQCVHAYPVAGVRVMTERF